MKRRWSLLLAGVMLLSVLAACSPESVKLMESVDGLSKLNSYSQRLELKVKEENEVLKSVAELELILDSDVRIEKDAENADLKGVLSLKKRGPKPLDVKLPFTLKTRGEELLADRETIRAALSLAGKFDPEMAMLSEKQLQELFGKAAYLRCDRSELMTKSMRTPTPQKIGAIMNFIQKSFLKFEDKNTKQTEKGFAFEMEQGDAVLEAFRAYFRTNEKLISSNLKNLTDVLAPGNRGQRMIRRAIAAFMDPRSEAGNYEVKVELEKLDETSNQLKLRFEQKEKNYSFEIELKSVITPKPELTLKDFEGEGQKLQLGNFVDLTKLRGVDRLVIEYDRSLQLQNYIAYDEDGKVLKESQMRMALIDGRTYLPFRQIAEMLGEKVEWNGAEKKAYAIVTGQKIDMSGELIEDRTFVKLRDFEKLGYLVDWKEHEKGGTITIR